MPIVSVSIPEKLLKELDDSLERRGFASRSEVLRQAVRFFIEEGRSLEVEGEVVAVVTVVYEKAKGRLLAHHEHEGLLLTFLHTHVDEGSCLEVLVLKGSAEAVRKLTDSIRMDERVKQVKITVLGGPR
ncbi:MAG: nickel-responsive transcriptional regulator NikR [Candidatus Hecatellales archaeon]|nr:MAG: nickel-responsive transcriptional regulator NikR [Candidatus Hecatellales archaeon]